jgi:NAD(P)-dependent dehydrogenase (short-subunit alcohol dehydrogenase family)
MMGNKFCLIGRNALITGAAGLLGKEHAKALLDQGAVVVLTDVNQEALDIARDYLASAYSSDHVLAYQMDVTSEDSIKKTLDILNSSGIHISILINNAAIDPKVSEHGSLFETSRLENYNPQQWNVELAVGLTGAFSCSKIFGAAMANSLESGVILNIASDLSVISPDQRLYSNPDLDRVSQPVKPITYSVIKAGLVGMTRYLSTYWIDQGVRCNALSPGGVENGQGADFTNQLISRIPMGRMANHDEYQSAIQFLCSDASIYMNGQNLIMDGGRSVW